MALELDAKHIRRSPRRNKVFPIRPTGVRPGIVDIGLNPLRHLDAVEARHDTVRAASDARFEQLGLPRLGVSRAT